MMPEPRTLADLAADLYENERTEADAQDVVLPEWVSLAPEHRARWVGEAQNIVDKGDFVLGCGWAEHVVNG